MLPANRLEAFVDSVDGHVARPQSRPALEAMEAKPALVAQPTLIDVDISTPHGSINFAIAGAVTGDTPAKRSCRMIDAIIATGAATATNRRCSLKEPHTDLKPEIGAGQRADRTYVYDISGVGIVQRAIL